MRRATVFAFEKLFIFIVLVVLTAILLSVCDNGESSLDRLEREQLDRCLTYKVC